MLKQLFVIICVSFSTMFCAEKRKPQHFTFEISDIQKTDRPEKNPHANFIKIVNHCTAPHTCITLRNVRKKDGRAPWYFAMLRFKVKNGEILNLPMKYQLKKLEIDLSTAELVAKNGVSHPLPTTKEAAHYTHTGIYYSTLN